jgi:polar amino acid transport system substrate-binding protein
LFGGLALFAAACGNDDDAEMEEPAEDEEDAEAPADEALAEWQESGVVIGIADEPPFGFEEGGEATGEAPELAREVFDRLGVEVTDFVAGEFGGLIDGLGAGRFDVIAAGMFINPERAENVLFSNPDYCATNAFAVPEGNPDNISDFESVADAGIRLGVLSGAVEEGFAQDAGVSSGNIQVFPGVPDLFDALSTGRIDAVALTSITVNFQTAEMEGFEGTEPFFPVVEGEEQVNCGGFGFRFEDQALRDAFNEALAELQDAGEVLPIVEEFGFDQLAVDTAKDITANDLAGGAYTEVGDPPPES